MPEGDTVWLAAHRLHEALAGRVLTRCELRVPQLATVDLSGRAVLAVLARGKHLLARIEPDLSLHSHLRMDGSWRLYRPGANWRGGPGWQVRAVLANAEWTAVGHLLPVLELVRTAEEGRLVGHLGPDLLGPDWDLDTAVHRLLAAPDRQLGEALLDQRNLAGIGNLYRNEVCFLRGVWPATRVGAVPDLPALVELTHRMLLRNRTRSDQVTTGDTRPGHRHWVFGRAGRPCLRCGTTVLRADQGQPARISYWCPRCQPVGEQ